MAEKQKPRKSHPGHQQEPNWRHKHHSNTSKYRYRREVVLEKFLPSQSFPISVPEDILIVYLAESELPACKTDKFVHSLGDSVSSRKFVPRERNTEKTVHENVRKHDEEVKIPIETKKVEEKTEYSEIWDIHEPKSEIPASLANSKSEGTIKRNHDIPSIEAKPAAKPQAPAAPTTTSIPSAPSAPSDPAKESPDQVQNKAKVSKGTKWETIEKEKPSAEVIKKPESIPDKGKTESKPEPIPIAESKDHAHAHKLQTKPETEPSHNPKQAVHAEGKKVHFEKEGPAVPTTGTKDSKPEAPSKPEPNKAKPQAKPDNKPVKEVKKPVEAPKEVNSAKQVKESQSSPLDSKANTGQSKGQFKSVWGQDNKKPFEDLEKPKNPENLENPAKNEKPASGLNEEMKQGQVFPSYNKELIETFVKLDNPFAKVLILTGKIDGDSVLFESSGKAFERLWFYKDRNGNVQGPFSCLEMFEWAVKGCFPSNLEIAFCNNEFAAMNGYQSKWKKTQVHPAGRALHGEGELKKEEVKSVKGPWGDSSKLFSNKK